MSETSPKEYFKNKRRYVQVGQLGRGGMAIVFESRDEYFQRFIAFKTLKDGPNRTKRETEFIREAMIMAKLEHPGIVPIHGLITDSKDLPSITMGKVQGLSLQAKIQESRKNPESWPLKERLQFFLKLVEIVAYAHNRGVLHRDIKPGNIMIGEVGEVILLDWGLAKVMELEPEEDISEEDSSISRIDDTVLTSMESMSGAIKGTPYYMSPESARGRSELVNEQSDVFSLGAVLYELITFEFYIKGTKAMEVLNNAADSNTKSLGTEELNSNIKADTSRLAPEVAHILRKSVSPEKLFRYRNAMELQHDLMAYFNDKPIPGFGDGIGFYRFKKWFSRNGLSLILLTIPILLTLYFSQIIRQKVNTLEQEILFEKNQYTEKRKKKQNRESELARLKKSHENILEQKLESLDQKSKIDDENLVLDIENNILNAEIESLVKKIELSNDETKFITKNIQQLDQDILGLSSTYSNLIQIEKRKKEMESYEEFLIEAPNIGKQFQFLNKFVSDGKLLSSLDYIREKEIFQKDPFAVKWFTNILLKKVKQIPNPIIVNENYGTEDFLEDQPKYITPLENLLKKLSLTSITILENLFPNEEWISKIELTNSVLYYSKSGKVIQFSENDNQYKSLAQHQTIPMEVSMIGKSFIGRYNEQYLFFQKSLQSNPKLIYHPGSVLAYTLVNNKLRVERGSKLYEYILSDLNYSNLGWKESDGLNVEEIDIDFEIDPATLNEYDNIIPSNYEVINYKMPLGPWLMVNEGIQESHFRNLDPKTGIDQPLWIISGLQHKQAISDGYGGWIVIGDKGELYSLKPKQPALPMSPLNVKFEAVFPIVNWNISLSQDNKGQVFIHYLNTGQYLFKAGTFPKIDSVQSDTKELQLSLNLKDGKTILLDL
jgi:serine/threonine protein kinase